MPSYAVAMFQHCNHYRLTVAENKCLQKRKPFKTLNTRHTNVSNNDDERTHKICESNVSSETCVTAFNFQSSDMTSLHKQTA